MSYNCDRAQENISAYVDGELGAIESIRFKLHILKCEKCREELNFEKDLIRTMSSENFFLPHNFSESLHRKLEVEYNKNPVKQRTKEEINSSSLSLSSKIFAWLNKRKLHLASVACLGVLVLCLYQFGGIYNIPMDETQQSQMAHYPKGIARIADTSGITDENITSQEVADVNQNVFDRFRNKYMTKKFISNLFLVNDTVEYSTTQDKGITSIMRTIKEVVTDNKSDAAAVSKANTSIAAIQYVTPTTASAKVALDLREKVPANVDDESMYGAFMVDRNSPSANIIVASNENHNTDGAAYGGETAIEDYSKYTPSDLSVETAIFTADIANFSAIKDVLNEYRANIEIQESDSNITISVDSVNYDIVLSQLKMSNLCAFNQTQGRDYTASYNNLVKKQSTFMGEPSKYNELLKITKEIKNLLSKIGKNTIKINFE